MDPVTFTLTQLQTLQSIGFNRISLGVQSFTDPILTSIGRTHTVHDIWNSIRMMEEVGIVDYSLDLISGLPGLDVQRWKETLDVVTSIHPRPKHLSLYDLQIESGTVFHRWYGDNDDDGDDVQRGVVFSHEEVSMTTQKSVLPLPSADDCANMYRYASSYLKSKGYEHYEISSYALLDESDTVLDSSHEKKEYHHVSKTRELSKSWRSRHNQIYWEIGGEWYAVGLGATSSLQGKRFTRPRRMADYIKWIHQQEQDYNQHTEYGRRRRTSNWKPSWLPDSQYQTKKKNNNNNSVHDDDDDNEKLCDIVMTRLRTSEGLDLDWILDTYGKARVDDVLRGAQLALELGLAVQTGNKGKGMGHCLCLVDPDGFLFSNSVISSIFVELDKENKM